MTAVRQPGTLVSSRQPLADAYDAALLDLDGVVYLGARASASRTDLDPGSASAARSSSWAAAAGLPLASRSSPRRYQS